MLVFLTLPAEEGATNGIEQCRCIFAALKALVRNPEVFAVLFSHLSGPLERYEDSQLRLRDDDGKTIQLFLTLIRNLLLGAEQHAMRSEVSEENEVKVRGAVV